MNENKELYSIVSPSEALNRGNLFDYYFWPYKYVANIKPTNERDELMQKIQMYAFAAHELNLYLDLHPNDTSMLMLFKDYEEKCKKLTSEYENKYGPLSVSEVNSTKEFTWVNNWPWEVKNV